jgi:hypothetical protein
VRALRQDATRQPTKKNPAHLHTRGSRLISQRIKDGFEHRASHALVQVFPETSVPAYDTVADDIDSFLAFYACRLPPDRQAAFYQDAQLALTGLRNNIGPGSAYRVVAALFRRDFIPLPDIVGRQGIRAHHRRSSKLAALPPVA